MVTTFKSQKREHKMSSQTRAGCTRELAIFSHVHPLRDIFSVEIPGVFCELEIFTHPHISIGGVDCVNFNFWVNYCFKLALVVI